jgi:Rrf2 family protein
MKVTAQEEYGLRCILQLVRASEDAVVQVPQIAQAEGLSIPYVEKLMRIISRAGLAKSVRGVNGGYRLAVKAEMLSLGDVMRALGNFPTPDEMCRQYTAGRHSCVHTGPCGVRSVWNHVASYLTELFDSIPLVSLVNGDFSKPIQLLPPTAFRQRLIQHEETESPIVKSLSKE